MKIVIDARESGTTTGRYVDKLVGYLHALKTDHDFTLLVKPHRVDFFRKIAPTFTVMETDYKEFTFGEQLGFKSQIKDLGADLVHFPMVQQPVLYKGKVVTTMQDLTTLRFRNKSKNRLVFTLKLQVYKWVNKRVARCSAHIITPTEFVKQDVMNYCGVPATKITVTLESADKITEAAQAVPMIDGKKFILYVGRPAENKNLERLVRAFTALKDRHPDLHLVFAGRFNGAYEKLSAFTGRLGTQQVIFTDFVSEGQLRWLYENAQAYVFPSLSEGFGLPGLEAMIHGCPVVSSNATCLPEVYGDAAHYFDPLDVDDMAAKISDVLNDDALRQQLITKGKEQAAKYSWKRMAEQTLAVYKKLM